jgi:hypothetical protein
LENDADTIDTIIYDLQVIKEHLKTAKYSMEDILKLRRLAIDCGVLAHDIAVALGRKDEKSKERVRKLLYMRSKVSSSDRDGKSNPFLER